MTRRRRAGAELARRHRDGAAGDRGGARGASRRAPRGGGAGAVRRRLRGGARRRRRRAAARSGIRAIGAHAEALAGGGFDLAILFTNSFASALAASRAGIAERWGYRRDWRGRLLTRAVPPRPRRRGAAAAPPGPAGPHHSAYYLRLVASLGMPPTRRPGRRGAGAAAAAVEQAAALLADAGVDAGGAAGRLRAGRGLRSAKRWPPERVAGAIAGVTRHGARAVLVGAAARSRDRPCDTIGARSGGAGVGGRSRRAHRRGHADGDARALRGGRRQRLRGDARGLGGRPAGGRDLRADRRAGDGADGTATRSSATTCCAGRACCAPVRSITGACAGIDAADVVEAVARHL